MYVVHFRLIQPVGGGGVLSAFGQFYQWGGGGGGVLSAFGRFNQWAVDAVRFQPIQPGGVRMYVNKGGGGGGARPPTLGTPMHSDQKVNRCGGDSGGGYRTHLSQRCCSGGRLSLSMRRCKYSIRASRISAVS